MALIGKRIVISGADFTNVRLDTEIYELTSISVTTQPNKTVYGVGETFNPAGMVITATLTGTISGNTKNNVVTEYTFSPTSSFDSTGSKTITISYTKNSITRTSTLNINVTNSTVYTITGNITDGSLSGATTIIEGGNATVNIIPSTGYIRPTQANINVVGASISSYNQLTGALVLNNPISNITITTTCPVQPAGDTWYTSTVTPSALTAVNVTGYGWSPKDTMFAPCIGKPINLVKFVSTNSSGTLEIGVAPSFGCELSAIEQIQTVNWDSSNKEDNVVTVILPTSITLTEGQFPVIYPNTQPATGAFNYLASEGNGFYTDAPISRRGKTNWSTAGAGHLNHDFGYRA